MKKITMFQTEDGKMFSSYTQAERHLESEFARVLDSISHRLLANYKYPIIGDCVIANLDLFKELIELDNEIKKSKKLK